MTYRIYDTVQKRFLDLENEDYGIYDVAICPQSGKVLGYYVSTGELCCDVLDDLIAVATKI